MVYIETTPLPPPACRHNHRVSAVNKTARYIPTKCDDVSVGFYGIMGDGR